VPRKTETFPELDKLREGFLFEEMEEPLDR